MRVLLCTASLDPAAGGPARSVPQLAAALSDLGHQVGLWTPAPGPERLPDCIRQADFRRLSGSFPIALETFGRPDVVHDNGLWRPCHHWVARECGRRGTPRVVSPRGMLEPWALQHKRWKKRLAWWLYQNRDIHAARFLHATSAQELSQLRRLGLRQPAVVLANGVEFPSGLERTRRTAGVASKRHALFLSRVHRQKGLDLLVEAWARVRPVGWVVHVVGPDQAGYRQSLQRAVNRARLQESWSFENMAEGLEKWRWMVQSDLFILPSFTENFGIVVAEALASGTPVITTTGTPWRGVLQQHCGWWVEPSVDALTAALREAVSLPDASLKQMGERGAEWMRKDFAWMPIARKMAAAYQWACAGGEVPAQMQCTG